MNRIEDSVDCLIGLLPWSGRIARSKNRLGAFADQGALGAANLFASVLAARYLGPEDFASIGIMLGAHYLMAGIHRALVTFPFILDQSDTKVMRPSWWWVNFSVSAGVALVLVLGAAVLAALAAAGFGLGWMATGVACAAMVSPLLCTADFGRRWLYQHGLAASAALSSVVYFTLSLSWVVAITSAPGATAWSASGAWAAAALGAILLSWASGKVGRGTFAEGWRHWQPFRRFSFWQAPAHLPYAIYNNSSVLLVGLFGGAIGAATFTAARTLAAPANSIVTAVDSIDKPRAARTLNNGGTTALKQSIRRTRRLLILLTGTFLLGVALGAPSIIRFLFGGQYADEATTVRILCGVFFLLGLNQPSETLLIVMRTSRLVLATRLVAATAAVLGLWIGSRLGGMEGMCWALLLVQLVNLVMLRAAESLATREGGPHPLFAPEHVPERAEPDRDSGP